MQKKDSTMRPIRFLLFFAIVAGPCFLGAQPAFSWPEGKKMALCLTFDDGRPSQVDTGTAVLNRLGAKATFYVMPGPVKDRLAGWQAAVAAGHEIGNHSAVHPCTGNFAWSREKALEAYTLEQMRAELLRANQELEALLGVRPRSFAYPCGQTFVGRGTQTQSYIPLIAELFDSGRGWLDEAPNDPVFCDPAQLLGIEMDGKTFEALLPVIEQARNAGAFLVLAGHEMGEGGTQTTRLSMLEKLIPYAQDPANGIWLTTVGEAMDYLKDHPARTQ